MRRLLIATDLSPRSERALARALRLARQHGAELRVLHVVDDALPAHLAETQIEIPRMASATKVNAVPPPVSGQPAPSSGG